MTTISASRRKTVNHAVEVYTGCHMLFWSLTNWIGGKNYKKQSKCWDKKTSGQDVLGQAVVVEKTFVRAIRETDGRNEGLIASRYSAVQTR